MLVVVVWGWMEDGMTYEMDVCGFGVSETDWIGRLGFHIKHYSSTSALKHSVQTLPLLQIYPSTYPRINHIKHSPRSPHSQ